MLLTVVLTDVVLLVGPIVCEQIAVFANSHIPFVVFVIDQV